MTFVDLSSNHCSQQCVGFFALAAAANDSCRISCGVWAKVEHAMNFMNFLGEGLIGSECDFSEDCEHINHSTCNIDDQCVCIEGFVASHDNLTCLLLASKIGDPCEIQEQCSEIPKAECKSNICVVAQAIINSSTTAKPKEVCTDDSQCSTFLVKRVCQNGTCILALPPISAGIPVLDILTLGKSCINESGCSGEGVTCIDKLCKCGEGFVLAENLKKCLPKAKVVGDSCTETGQCLGLNGICESGKCMQPMKVQRDFGEAVRGKVSSLLIGSTCQYDNECKHMSHALCLENVCQCEENYVTSIASDSCLEKAKKEGDACTIDKQCEHIKGATCVQQKCIKPAMVGTKLGKDNSGSTNSISKLALAAILFVKVFSV